MVVFEKSNLSAITFLTFDNSMSSNWAVAVGVAGAAAVYNCWETGAAALTCWGWASKTSAWIILPFGPVPWTFDKLTLVSCAVFLAKGEATTLPSNKLIINLIKIRWLGSEVWACWAEAVCLGSSGWAAFLTSGWPEVTSSSPSLKSANAATSFLFSTKIATNFYKR